jgi:hypothetical protein
MIRCCTTGLPVMFSRRISLQRWWQGYVNMMTLALRKGALTHRLLIYTMGLLAVIVIFICPEYWYNKGLLLLSLFLFMTYQISHLLVPTGLSFDPANGLRVNFQGELHFVQKKSYILLGFYCLSVECHDSYLILSRLDLKKGDNALLHSIMRCL